MADAEGGRLAACQDSDKSTMNGAAWIWKQYSGIHVMTGIIER
jgi:hypothetical protein